MGNMKFNGLSTKDLDLIIQFKPDYNFPQKDITTEHIPGRNGDLYIDNKSWQNVERSYSLVSVFRPGTDFVSNSEKMIKWLTKESGYFRLEDDYDPHVYRMAAFKPSSGSLPNLYDKVTVLNVTFDCKPQRYFKSGEKKIDFTNSLALLENPSGYPALPDITIDGISNPSQDDVLLLTVGTTLDKENFDKVSSIITLSNIPQDVTSITLISEQQTCYSNQNRNINGSINLNDTQFPVLNSGTSLIKIKKYKENSGLIGSYNTKIEENQLVCSCKYMPFKNQVETKQKIIPIKSWNLLKQQVQEVYDVKAYASYCMEKAEEYTFESYNNILAANCVSYTVRLSDLSDLPAWLSINDTTISVGDISTIFTNQAEREKYSQNKGYFYIGSDYITLKSNGDVLATNLKSGSSLTVTFYPAIIVNGVPEIGVKYEGEPGWCEMVVNYNNGSHEKLDSISFVTGSDGFFYLPKSGLFSSAKWEKITTVGTVLTTFKWSSLSKAFMPSGISVSKTATVTYYFLPYPYDETHEFLQYEPIKSYKLNENGEREYDGDGNPIMETTNAVHFEVYNVSNDLSSYNLRSVYTKNDGTHGAAYFRKDGDPKDFSQNPIDYGSNIVSGSIDAKSSYVIYTIGVENFPKYTSVKDWPDGYIDPTPKKNNPQIRIDIDPNTNELDYEVIKRGWFRVKYTNQNGDEVNTPWVLLEEHDVILSNAHAILYPSDSTWPSFDMKADMNIAILYLDPIENSNDFPIGEYKYEFEDGKFVPDIAFFDKNGDLYSENKPPVWLKVEVSKGEKDDYTDATLIFKVGDQASNTSLFKWDSKSIWTMKNKISEGHLTDSARTDDTTVYYLIELPQYTQSELLNKYTAIVNQNAATGDPETVSFYPINECYYKAKNDTNWKWLKVEESICMSKNSESTTIYDLTESQTQDSFDITIIPRWWSL